MLANLFRKPPKTWYELLPKPYADNPYVVVMMVPNSWKVGTVDTTDEKYRFAVMISDKGTVRGIQVIDVDACTYLEQKEVLQQYNVEPADPAFIGRLDKIPKDLLLDADRHPLVMMRDAMWRQPLDLNAVWKRSDLKC